MPQSARRSLAFTLLMLPLALGACSGSRAARDDAGPAILTGAELSAHEDFYQAGDLIFGPQPDAARFGQFKAEGVTTVINLRSNEEMADLITEEGLDETATLQAAGLRYIHIPLGGDDGYAPEDVEAFANAVETAEGPVLIHCFSGGRARTMWQAYLVKHRGYSLAEAEAVAATIGGTPTSLEMLLGREIKPSLGSPLPPTPPEQ